MKYLKFRSFKDFFPKNLVLLLSFKLEIKKLTVASNNPAVFILRTEYDGHSKKKKQP